MSNRALILGGELRNKGSQDMSFRAVVAARELLGLEPVLLSTADTGPSLGNRVRGLRAAIDVGDLAFEVSFNGMELLPGLPTTGRTAKRMAKQAVMKVLYARQLHDFKRALEDAEVCLDVSGFAFSAQRGFARCMQYLDRIQTLHDYGVPTYLLPQSFGPFLFDDSRCESTLRERAREVLRYPRLICARERQGLDDIRALCPDANCVHVPDLVLQGADLDPSDLFVDPATLPVHPGIVGSPNVGVVPNAKAFDAGDENDVLALWGLVVQELLDRGYGVHVIRHAEDDLQRCLQVKGLFEKDDRVRLHAKNRLCFEYGDLFRACDFVVASRYHSIVHAYKSGVPCVALGWAEKYRELLGMFGQDGYGHDVRHLDEQVVRDVLASLLRMSQNHVAESSAIRAKMRDVRQLPSALDLVAKDFGALKP